MFSGIPLKHDIPDIVAGHRYGFLSKNLTIDEEKPGERYHPLQEKSTRHPCQFVWENEQADFIASSKYII